ncbi:O-antigen ligase family protein [Aliarcobacter lanthieri]|uniref:O-antigen ligase family protein n=1 Tax=Aliarcobacter lanthieri TaxID=1355374 RepID=UPI00047A6D11|nr:O-antigen ligase family protein [Aliarcobacter lanthieri]
MIKFIERSGLDYFKLYILFYIFIVPWDLLKGINGTGAIVMLVWYLSIGNKKGYFIKFKEIFRNKALIFLFLFLFYNFLSLLWTEDIENGLKRVKDYNYYWILIPILFTVFNKEDALKGIYTFIFSFGVYSIFSVLIYFGLIHIDGSNSLNPQGIIGYSKSSIYMSLGVILSIFFAYYEKNNKLLRNIFLIIFLFSLISLSINNGRMAQLSFLATLIILMIVYRNYLFKYKKTIIFLLISIFIGILFLFNSGKTERFELGFKQLFSANKTNFEGSWGYRLYYYYVAADHIKEMPLFGAGVGDNKKHFDKFVQKHPSPAAQLRDYHSSHLDYLTKYGIIGYSIFLLSIIFLFIKLRKNKLYFFIGIVFFSITMLNAFGNNTLTQKPYNLIYVLFFVLLVILSKDSETKISNSLKVY